MIHTDTFKKIAEALLTDYSIVYYVDAVTGEYRRYSVDPRVNSMRLGLEGADFFGER